MDYVLRIRLTDEIESVLENNNVGKSELEPVIDIFYKPRKVQIKHFSPRMNIVRLRRFPDREELAKTKVFKLGLGYTDEKERIDSLDGYDEWGRLKSHSTEYRLAVSDTTVKILRERFPFGRFIKIEAPSTDVLSRAVNFLGVRASETINKTSAEMLAEHMGLI